MPVAPRGARASLRRTLVAALAIALTACSPSRSPSAVVTARPGPGTPTTSASGRASIPTTTASPVDPSSAASTRAFDPQNVKPVITSVTGGLHSPVDVTDPGDGSGRLFVAEQAGRIRIVDNGKLVERPFLDIIDRVSSGGERGLL